MKKRVLFVGAESDEFKVFEEALPDAEMVAVQRSDALDVASLTLFHVVVVHSTKGNGGLELLAEFAKQHPRMIRFLLANTVDDEVFMECVWNTHQFLTVPCKAEVVQDRIARAFAADSWLGNEKLKSLVARMRTFPSLPSTYFEILKALDSPTGYSSVGDLISRDMAITAKVLQTVNSAVFGLARTITSPSEATFILGVEIVKALVLSVQTYNQLDRVKPLYFTADKIWQHSLAVGTLARRIAQVEGVDQNTADAAFTGALFHDLGKLLLASNFSSEYDGAHALAQRRGIPVYEVETELFGATHAETGAYLLAIWGLPTAIVEAVAFHHCPSRTTGEEFSALTAVHVANAIVNAQQIDKNTAPSVDLAYLGRLGLADRIETWRACGSDPAATTIKPVSAPKQASTPKQAAKPGRGTTPAPAPAKPAATTAAKPRRKSSGKAVWAGACAFVAAIVIGVLCFASRSKNTETSVSARENETPAVSSETATTPDSPVTPITTPVVPPQIANAQPGVESPATTPSTGDPSPVRLEAIFYRPSNPSVVINGKTLFQGGSVAGAKVISIGRDSVTVDIGGTQKVLRITRKP